jgi:hypothetical protein
MKFGFRLTEYHRVEVLNERILSEIFEPIREDITVGESR